jgi:hypothetical protein
MVSSFQDGLVCHPDWSEQKLKDQSHSRTGLVYHSRTGLSLAE